MKRLIIIISIICSIYACTEGVRDYATSDTGNIVGFDIKLSDDGEYKSFVKTKRGRAIVTDIEPLKEGFSIWGGYGNELVFDGKNVLWSQSVNGNASGWIYNGLVMWTENTYNFCGLFPSTITTSYESGILTIGDYIVDQNEDLLFASVPEHKYPDDGSVVNFNFKHALSAVSFSLVFENSNGQVYNNTYKIVEATMNNLYVGGTITLNNNSGQIQSSPSNKGTISASAISLLIPTSTPMLLVMPQTNNVDLYIKLDVSGTIIEINKANMAINWEPGIHYIYNIVIDKNQNISLKVQTTQWEVLDIEDIIIS
jgi:hypothetical protein